VLNRIFVAVVVASILMAAAAGSTPGEAGRMTALVDAILTQAKDAALNVAIPLIGIMAFFLGLMRVAEDAGLLRVVARALAPIMRRLFPRVPPDHPAMSAMILNIASNMLGLGNAATPFGIKAMEELDRLNGEKGTATDAMVLFLALNTAGLALLPTGVVGLRAALGSENAMAIWIPTWFASGVATVVGVTAALLLRRLPWYRATEPPLAAAAPGAGESEAPAIPGAEPGNLHPPRFAGFWVAAFWLAFAAFFGHTAWQLRDRPLGEAAGALSPWFLGALVGGLVLFGWSRGVRVYDSLVEGGKEGFQVAVRIIPYLVAILVMVGMFRAAGGIDLLVRALGPLTDRIGLPAEALPMALLRPLTGSGAYGVMAAVMEEHGPDSFVGYMVSTFQGSTETTFYVLAVYFGAVGIKRTRHTLPACLLADVAGILAAVLIVNVLLG